MNKKIKLITIGMILIVIVSINISYAISSKNHTDNFFEINKNELSAGEVLEMTIDLLKIDYKQFKFTLNSNIENQKVYTDENDIELNTENNDVTINIDKEKLSLNKITLYYQIPENIEVGTKIIINVQIIINENEEEKIVAEKQTEITIINNNNEKDKEENENKQNQKQEDMNKELQQNQSNEATYKNLNQVVQKESSQSVNNNTKISNEQTETAIYNGSNNNYLSSIEIEEGTLTTNFKKERTTYFLTVEGLEKITIKTTAEDSNSKVTITGTDLKKGENKILITVTAENGDVRYYRIYITNN